MHRQHERIFFHFRKVFDKTLFQLLQKLELLELVAVDQIHGNVNASIFFQAVLCRLTNRFYNVLFPVRSRMGSLVIGNTMSNLRTYEEILLVSTAKLISKPCVVLHEAGAGDQKEKVVTIDNDISQVCLLRIAVGADTR